MSVDFRVAVGALFACRRCDNSVFVSEYAQLESWENDLDNVYYSCTNCGLNATTRLEKLRGKHHESLQRITVKR